jgi:hypothetical protein
MSKAHATLKAPISAISKTIYYVKALFFIGFLSFENHAHLFPMHWNIRIALFVQTRCNFDHFRRVCDPAHLRRSQLVLLVGELLKVFWAIQM